VSVLKVKFMSLK